MEETVNLSPVSLFNYRLSTIAAKEKSSNLDGVEDINSMTETFLRELRQHRKDVNPDRAGEATRQNPNLEPSFLKIGLSLKGRKGNEHANEDEELPQYEEQPPLARKSSLQMLEEGLAKLVVKHAT